MRRLGFTQEHKTKRLLKGEEIGDRKPSQFVPHHQCLVDASIPESVICPLWPRGLSHELQVATIRKDTSLDNQEQEPETPAASNKPASTQATDVQLTLDQFISMKLEVAEMRNKFKCPRSKSHSRTPSPVTSVRKTHMCLPRTLGWRRLSYRNASSRSAKCKFGD